MNDMQFGASGVHGGYSSGFTVSNGTERSSVASPTSGLRSDDADTASPQKFRRQPGLRHDAPVASPTSESRGDDWRRGHSEDTAEARVLPESQSHSCFGFTGPLVWSHESADKLCVWEECQTYSKLEEFLHALTWHSLNPLFCLAEKLWLLLAPNFGICRGAGYERPIVTIKRNLIQILSYRKYSTNRENV